MPRWPFLIFRGTLRKKPDEGYFSHDFVRRMLSFDVLTPAFLAYSLMVTYFLRQKFDVPFDCPASTFDNWLFLCSSPAFMQDANVASRFFRCENTNRDGLAFTS